MKPQDKSLGIVLTANDPMMVCKRIMDGNQQTADIQEQSARSIIQHHGGGKLSEELGDGIARICAADGSVYVIHDIYRDRPEQAAVDVAYWMIQKINAKSNPNDRLPVINYQLQEPECGLFVLTEAEFVPMAPVKYTTLVSSNKIRDVYSALINLL